MAAADYRLMTEATGQRIAAALEALSGFGAYLTTADVVNNLTSTATDKPLSAAQGKALNTAINSIDKLAIKNFHDTTKAEIESSLQAEYAGNYVVFAVVYNVPDLAIGWYCIMRNSTMSATTQFLKLI